MVDPVSPRNQWPWVLSAMAHLGVVGLAAALWVSVTPPPRGVPVLKLMSAAQPRPRSADPVPTVPPPALVPPTGTAETPLTDEPTPGATEAPLPSEPRPLGPATESSPPEGLPEPPVAESPAVDPEPEPVYLPQDQVSLVPRLPVEELRARIRYPTAARRLGLEATVGLELLIDRTGVIRQVLVIQDPGHGFAQAAVRAFEGLSCTPAQAGGVAVAVRFRVPVRFRLDQML